MSAFPETFPGMRISTLTGRHFHNSRRAGLPPSNSSADPASSKAARNFRLWISQEISRYAAQPFSSRASTPPMLHVSSGCSRIMDAIGRGACETVPTRTNTGISSLVSGIAESLSIRASKGMTLTEFEASNVRQCIRTGSEVNEGSHRGRVSSMGADRRHDRFIKAQGAQTHAVQTGLLRQKSGPVAVAPSWPRLLARVLEDIAPDRVLRTVFRDTLSSRGLLDQLALNESAQSCQSSPQPASPPPLGI